MNKTWKMTILRACILAGLACSTSAALALKLKPGQQASGEMVVGFSTYGKDVREQYPIKVRLNGVDGLFSGYAMHARGRISARITQHDSGLAVNGFLILPAASGNCWAPTQQAIKTTCQDVRMRPGEPVSVVFPGGVELDESVEEQ